MNQEARDIVMQLLKAAKDILEHTGDAYFFSIPAQVLHDDFATIETMSNCDVDSLESLKGAIDYRIRLKKEGKLNG